MTSIFRQNYDKKVITTGNPSFRAACFPKGTIFEVDHVDKHEVDCILSTGPRTFMILTKQGTPTGNVRDLVSRPSTVPPRRITRIIKRGKGPYAFASNAPRSIRVDYEEVGGHAQEFLRRAHENILHSLKWNNEPVPRLGKGEKLCSRPLDYIGILMDQDLIESALGKVFFRKNLLEELTTRGFFRRFEVKATHGYVQAVTYTYYKVRDKALRKWLKTNSHRLWQTFDEHVKFFERTKSGTAQGNAV